MFFLPNENLHLASCVLHFASSPVILPLRGTVKAVSAAHQSCIVITCVLDPVTGVTCALSHYGTHPNSHRYVAAGEHTCSHTEQSPA